MGNREDDAQAHTAGCRSARASRLCRRPGGRQLCRRGPSVRPGSPLPRGRLDTQADRAGSAQPGHGEPQPLGVQTGGAHARAPARPSRVSGGGQACFAERGRRQRSVSEGHSRAGCTRHRPCHLPRSRTLSPHRPRPAPSPFPLPRVEGHRDENRVRLHPRDSPGTGERPGAAAGGGGVARCRGGGGQTRLGCWSGCGFLRPRRVPRGTHIFAPRGPLCSKRAQGVSVPPSCGGSQTGAPAGRGPHAGAGRQRSAAEIRLGSWAGERGLHDGGGRCPHGAPRRGTAAQPWPGNGQPLPRPGHRATSVMVTTRGAPGPGGAAPSTLHTTGRPGRPPQGASSPALRVLGPGPGWGGPWGPIHTLRLHTLARVLRRASRRRRRLAAACAPRYLLRHGSLRGLGIPPPLLPGRLLGPTQPGPRGQEMRCRVLRLRAT